MTLSPEEAKAGQAGLEEHYAAWAPNQARDFRASSLSRLVASLVPRGKVLDLGCGSGAVTELLVARGDDVTAQDLSVEMLALCRRRLKDLGLPSSGVREGGVDAIPEREAFDVIVNLDVIEHIEDDEAALRAMHAALKPGGCLVISVPAMRALYGPKDVAVGHYRRYDRADLERVLSHAGFALSSLRWWNALGVPAVWLANRLNRRVSEDFRYAGKAEPGASRPWRTRASDGGKRALNALLRGWFLAVENEISFGRGLTLLALAHKSRKI